MLTPAHTIRSVYVLTSIRIVRITKVTATEVQFNLLVYRGYRPLELEV